MQRIEQWKRITAVVPVVVFGVASLVASGGGDVTYDPDCGYFALTENSCFRAAPPGPSAPPVAQSKRFPVVAVPSVGARAAIMSTERENDDPQRPVQKFGSLFTFVPPALGQAAALAGPTDQTFIASRRPDLAGHNTTLATDASGDATAIWEASNAGTPELYASQFSAVLGGWGPRFLLATLGRLGVSAERVAMDGRGGALVAWSESEDLIRTRIYLPAQGWLPPLAPISAAAGGLYDVAMRPQSGVRLVQRCGLQPRRCTTRKLHLGYANPPGIQLWRRCRPAAARGPPRCASRQHGGRLGPARRHLFQSHHLERAGVSHWPEGSGQRQRDRTPSGDGSERRDHCHLESKARRYVGQSRHRPRLGRRGKYRGRQPQCATGRRLAGQCAHGLRAATARCSRRASSAAAAGNRSRKSAPTWFSRVWPTWPWMTTAALWRCGSR